jgi:predicted nucleic acid-binding protein
VRDYSKALHAIKSADAAIFIDCVVLSEFINRYSRRLFHIARESDRSVTDYKIYRDSPNFESGAREIAKAGRRLLQHAKAVETGFESCNRLAVLAAFENERADFNDGMIAELCRLRGFRLVTNDGDFRNVDLDILTANKGMVP